MKRNKEAIDGTTGNGANSGHDSMYQLRKDWNASNYKQLNVALPPLLAKSFKEACSESGVPARQILMSLIEGYVYSVSEPISNCDEGMTDGSHCYAAFQAGCKIGLGVESTEKQKKCGGEKMYSEIINGKLTATTLDAMAKAAGISKERAKAIKSEFGVR